MGGLAARLSTHNIKLARIAAAVIQLAAGTVDGHDPEAAVVARHLIAGSVDASTLLFGARTITTTHGESHHD